MAKILEKCGESSLKIKMRLETGAFSFIFRDIEKKCIPPGPNPTSVSIGNMEDGEMPADVVDKILTIVEKTFYIVF